MVSNVTRLRVSDVLQRDRVVSVHEATPLGEVNKVLAANDISGVPVVDDRGFLVGEISQTDLVRRMSHALTGVSADGKTASASDRAQRLEEEFFHSTARDTMQRKVRYVAPYDALRSVVQMMRMQRIHRVIVVEDGCPIGVLSSFDLLRLLENPDFYGEFYGHGAGR